MAPSVVQHTSCCDQCSTWCTKSSSTWIAWNTEEKEYLQCEKRKRWIATSGWKSRCCEGEITHHTMQKSVAAQPQIKFGESKMPQLVPEVCDIVVNTQVPSKTRLQISSGQTKACWKAYRHSFFVFSLKHSFRLFSLWIIRSYGEVILFNFYCMQNSIFRNICCLIFTVG